jgi:hypothetical protein
MIMKIRALVLAAFSALALAASVAGPASADFPGRHPMYVHAMGDLRFAHALLDHGDYRPGVNAQEDMALTDIARAYADIKQAGFDDGKDIDAHDIDAGIDHPGRLHRALEALRRAHSDVAKEEDDPAAVGLRDRAIRDIGGAIDHVKHALGYAEHYN